MFLPKVTKPLSHSMTPFLMISSCILDDDTTALRLLVEMLFASCAVESAYIVVDSARQQYQCIKNINCIKIVFVWGLNILRILLRFGGRWGNWT